MTVEREPSTADYASAYLGGYRSALDTIDVHQVGQFLDLLTANSSQSQRWFIAGNGGSAATASHMACDLGAAFRAADTPKPPLVVALSDATSRMSAIANDHGYRYTFSQQMEGVFLAGDLLIAISVSGRSPNVVEAVTAARDAGGRVAALLGHDGGTVADLSDAAVIVPNLTYGHVEDIHLMINHLVVGRIRGNPQCINPQILTAQMPSGIA